MTRPSLYRAAVILTLLSFVQNVLVSAEEAQDRELRTGESRSSRGREVLMILYLCVLGLCFFTPFFYYIRLHYDERQNRRTRYLEAQAFAAALMQSSSLYREENMAHVRKFLEERRARLVQLFAPVRMQLKEEHFCRSEKKGYHTDDEDLEETERLTDDENDEPEEESKEEETDDADCENPYGDDLTPMIYIPPPGLRSATDSTEEEARRLVSGMCTICLSSYRVGSDVVWSSNEDCEHCFHEHCIERWLMKQKEGPLCPCCRRDFVVDPYDIEERAMREDKNENASRSVRNNRSTDRRHWFSWTGSIDDTIDMELVEEM